MKTEYKLVEDTINNDDIEKLVDWLKPNPWLTQGEVVKEFEQRWAEWTGTSHALFVNSGSSANMLMYYALIASNILKNKNVIAPAVSWPSTITPAFYFGLNPILCEANENTFGMDINQLESLLQEHKPGIVIIDHTLGIPGELDEILSLKEKYKFFLLEDSCTSIGSTYKGKRTGSFGDMSSFSFYFGHPVSTIEGGMICTDDDELYEILLQLRSYGWSKNLPQESQDAKALKDNVLDFNRPFTFYYPGFNVRSSDLNARIGLAQMDRIDNIIESRKQNHKLYQSLFRDIPVIKFQENPNAEISSIAFGLIAPSSSTRDSIGTILADKKIETRPIGAGNMSRQPFWKDKYKSINFPVADKIFNCGLQLPNHPGLKAEDIKYISSAVSSALIQLKVGAAS